MPYDRIVRQPILAPLPELGTPGHMSQGATISPANGNPTTKGTGAIGGGGVVPGTNKSGNNGSMGEAPWLQRLPYRSTRCNLD